MTLTHVIGGREVAGNPRGETTLIDPSTGEPYDNAPIASAADLDLAFAGAEAGFATWRRMTPQARAERLWALADLLLAHHDEIVDTEVRNTGKPRASMVADEMPHIVDCLRFSAAAGRMLDGQAAGEYAPGHTSWLRREPVGVVAAISPWNYPLMMAMWKVAPALSAGNAVVLKSAETTPVTPLMLGRLALEAGLPDGVLTVVCGDRDTGRAMVAHPVPQLVAITGSVAAGREVAATAGRLLKRTHLELGGKAPVVVLDDADLTLVPSLLGGSYFNAGQSCTAATRVIATPAIHDGLVAALAAGAAAVTVGEDGYYGALNNPDQLDRVLGFLDRLPPHAQVVAGGARLDRPGFYVAPTVVAGLAEDDEITRDEVFGPVVSVQRAADTDDAVRLANATGYGLSASVWTRDHSSALRLSAEIDAGAVWINCHSVLAMEMPHGGVKDSGHGSDLSRYSVADYTRVKHVLSRW